MAGKQYFCSELNNVLSCFHDRIMSCCTGQIGPIYYEAYRGQKINWDAFKQVKIDGFNQLNEIDIENSPCKDCFFLREKKETDIIKDQSLEQLSLFDNPIETERKRQAQTALRFLGVSIFFAPFYSLSEYSISILAYLKIFLNI